MWLYGINKKKFNTVNRSASQKVLSLTLRHRMTPPFSESWVTSGYFKEAGRSKNEPSNNPFLEFFFKP